MDKSKQSQLIYLKKKKKKKKLKKKKKKKKKERKKTGCILTFLRFKTHAFVVYHMKIGLDAQTSCENKRRSVKLTTDRQGSKHNCTVQ
jgi:hypothetical protein